MDLLQVIIKPYLTEKTMSVREKNKKEVISFVVHPKATKNDIKKAFVLIYQVKPESINTIVNKPANIKTGTRVPGVTKLTKIAYVTLPEGIKLAVTNDEIETAKEEIKETSTNKKELKEKITEVKEAKIVKSETASENKSKTTSKKTVKKEKVSE